MRSSPFLKPPSNDSKAWLVVDILGNKSSQAIKFFLAARLIGPEGLGTFAIAMVCAAIAESLSDTGLSHGVAQRRDQLSSHDWNATWTLQIIRGIAATILMSLISAPIGYYYAVGNEFWPLIFIALAIPILRGSQSTIIIYYLRTGNFRRAAQVNLVGAIVDLLTTGAFFFGSSPLLGIVVGTVAGELSKNIISHAISSFRNSLDFDFRSLKSVIGFGWWIWAASFATLIMTQADKLLIGKWMSMSDLALYQLSSKVAQLSISEPSNVVSNSSFPRLSKINREEPKNVFPAFRKTCFRLNMAIIPAAAAIAALAAEFVDNIFGDAWIGTTNLIPLAMLNALIGANIALCSAALKAAGRPKLIAIGTAIQLCLFVPAALFLGRAFGLPGFFAAGSTGGIAMLSVTGIGVYKLTARQSV